MRTDADSYVESRRSEGERFYLDKQSEAEEYVSTRHREADEYVAARQGEVYKNAAEAEAAHDRALAGIADAREQVKELLEQARAQSEFIRQEAEEVIRSKVRANIDQAERRIARLRITEQASRERIIAAQSELQSAISRLDAEPVQELGEGTDDLVIAEAEQRVLAAGAMQLQGPTTTVAEEDVIDLEVEPQPVGSMSSAGSVAAVPVNEMGDVDQVLSEPPIEPQDEDALSRLVREAMQRAVESARGSDQG